MNNLTKNLLKISAGFGICILGAFTNSNSQVKANTCADNPNSLSAACYITPATYKIRVYEMGLCTSDPLAGTYINSEDEITTDNLIDESSCTATFKSTSGSLVDLSGNSSQDLTGTNFRPSSGVYPSAYIKIKNTFTLKGSYQINGTTYYSKANGAKDTTAANNVEWDEDLKDFDNGNACNGIEADRLVAGSETFTSGVTGTMKALLATANGDGTYTGVTKANCATSTRLYGVFAPTSPVTITDETQGLEVTFSITNRGMTIIPDGSGGMYRFSSGPFSPAFETY